MMRFYSKLVKNPTGYLFYAIFSALTLWLSSEDFLFLDVFLKILGGIIVLGLPTFCFVYFLFTRNDEICIQAILVDCFLNLLFICCVIIVIVGGKNSEMLSSAVFLVPIPSIATRIAYYKNSKLHT